MLHADATLSNSCYLIYIYMNESRRDDWNPAIHTHSSGSLGSSRGARVGAGVGDCVGACVGAWVGASVGATVGTGVGIWVGAGVGGCVGAGVGACRIGQQESDTCISAPGPALVFPNTAPAPFTLHNLFRGLSDVPCRRG